MVLAPLILSLQVGVLCFTNQDKLKVRHATALKEKFCTSTDSITLTHPLKDGDVLVSDGETFALGFFSPRNSSDRYVGIWYNKVSEQTVVWVANRDRPITNSTGILSLDETGNLVLRESGQPFVFWSTNVSGVVNNDVDSAKLLDSGNLVLFQGQNREVYSWQSFDYPSNTILPGSKFGVDKKTGLNREATSWITNGNPGVGEYSFKMEIVGSPQLFLYQDTTPIWRGGSWTGHGWSGIPEMTHIYLFNVTYTNNNDEVALSYVIHNSSILSRFVVKDSGKVERSTWHETDRRWFTFWSAPKDECDGYSHCGPFGLCDPYKSRSFECDCLPGFEPRSPHDWYLRDASGGCKRKEGTDVCKDGEGFVELARVKVPDTSTARVNMSLGSEACEGLCLRDCTCMGYAVADISDGGRGCITWNRDMIDTRTYSDGGQSFFVRVDAQELANYSTKKQKSTYKNPFSIIGLPVIAAGSIIPVLIICCYIRKKRANRRKREIRFGFSDGLKFVEGSLTDNDIGENVESHVFNLRTIVAATDNFSHSNKIGEGGFGSVYKGKLLNGQEIAVKRLSQGSCQGMHEFTNEVTLIAKLQHRNLVRLFGYCFHKEEKMLIYEYLPNKGLDSFIFDQEKRSILDWERRFLIIRGIVRGLLYLHQDSRLRIIHRDLKASNVLLDADLNPKISDFGMAKIFGGDQDQAITHRVVGTYGYMSPEYAMEGLFSVKSDVYSFGVLVLEIVSGRRNNGSVNLIGHVWDLWKQDKALTVVDSSLGNEYDAREILLCIHVGILCVQESASDRPTMTDVAYMLSNRETKLPTPNQPAHIFRQMNDGTDHSITTLANGRAGLVYIADSITWVSWKATMNEADKGGLNIGSLKAFNVACLGSGGGDSGLGKMVSGKSLDKELEKGGIQLAELIKLDDQSNTWKWEPNKNGTFTVNSLRKIYDANYLLSDDKQTVWRKEVPKKINLFIWRLRKWNKLPDLNDYDNVDELIDMENDPRWSREDSIKVGVIVRAFFWILWCNRNDLRFNSKVKTLPTLASEVTNTSFLWISNRSKIGKNITKDNWIFCTSTDSITLTRPLKDGDILVSSGETFALGFFSPRNSSNRYVGIWYNKVSEQTVVWVANRDRPITNSTGILSLDETGNLVLRQSGQPFLFWSTNVSGLVNNDVNSGKLLDSGNLVLFQGQDRGVYSWQSFDYPSNTILPGLKFGEDLKSGLNRMATSWKSGGNPGIGEYSFKLELSGSPQIFLYKGATPIWRGGSWTGHGWSGVPEMTPNYLFDVTYTNNNDEVALVYVIRNSSIFSRLVLNETGKVERSTWHESDRRWFGFWSAPKDECDGYSHCGPFGLCDPYKSGTFECDCLPGYEPQSPQDWYLRDATGGCKRKAGAGVCTEGEGFVELAHVKVPDTSTARVNMSLGSEACEGLCLRDCTCMGYAVADISGGGRGCVTWSGGMIDARTYSDGGQPFFIRVDADELAKYSTKKGKSYTKKLFVTIGLPVIAAGLIIFACIWCYIRKNKANRKQREIRFGFSDSLQSMEGSLIENDIGENVDLHVFDLSTIVTATDKFSPSNKLGEGGFGSVYKGKLLNGQEIAVKRLSQGSGQGMHEFTNEVTLIAKLQHRNLVRLFGYCFHKEEKMLIYEYLPNKGLDSFIFDQEKASLLDWKKRFFIIRGIVRGLLYLHQDSRLRIIHRDMKASNVLLDADLNPKISDFGMAKIFGGDQDQAITRRVVGTYGYMSPEYAMEGLFSVKSDVYSFGILVLEIISGRKNNSYYLENSVNLIGHVWDLWNQDKALTVVDSSLGDEYDAREILRCIHVGILCVQESANDRPTMTDVAYMLSNRETKLPTPNQPAYIFRQLNYGTDNSTTASASGGAGSVYDSTITIVRAR
ncbi:hypothetical protein LXL04_010119 [Taraxacum kok-saghyz]